MGLSALLRIGASNKELLDQDDTYQYQLLCMRCSYQYTVREGDAGSNFAWSLP